MLGLDRRAARAAWTVLLVALLAAGAYAMRGTLLILSVAILLAYLLSPLVDLVDRLTPRRFPRNLSLAVVYVLLLAFLAGALGLIGSRIVQEATNLAGKLPEYLKRVELPKELPLPDFLKPYRAEILAGLRSQLETGATELVPALRRVGLQILAALSGIALLVVVPILSFFFLKDGREFRRLFLEQFDEGPRRALFEDILADVNLLLAQFMRAIVLLSLATFVVYSLSFGIAGVPYAVLLAGIAGVLEVIPVLGPLTAAAVILLVAGFSGFGHLLWIGIFLAVYRVFLDYVLQPRLMSSGVALHPLLVICGVLAGERIAGVTGVFLSIPVLAILRVVYVRLRKSQGLRRAAPQTP